MTDIQNEVTRIARNVANTLNAIESKGVSTAGANSDNMAALVGQIPQGGAVESVDGVAPDESGNVHLGAAKVGNYITELTADEFEALTEAERIALYAAGVRVLAVAKRSGDMTQTQMQEIADFLYPVGLIVELRVETNPASLWGIGTWESYMPGRVLIGAGTADSGTVYTAGQKGGIEEEKIENKYLPWNAVINSKDGTSAGNTGRNTVAAGTWSFSSITDINGYVDGNDYGVPMSNMQPYGVVYRWLRVA